LCKEPNSKYIWDYKNVYEISRNFYTTDLQILEESNSGTSKPLFGEPELHIPGETNTQSQLSEHIMEWDFYNTCCSISMWGILNQYKDQCTVIEYETPSSINEKYIYKEDGLLTLPTYKNVKGVRTKIIMNDNRKTYVREVIVNLLLLMNEVITPEDLVYNVFRWCHEHVSFNKGINNHILNNKNFVQICIETYKKFHNPHSPEYEKHLANLRKKYKSDRKNYINPYYFGLHFDDDTYCCNRYEIWKHHPWGESKYEYLPITPEQLEKGQVRGRKQRSDKQNPHSQTTKLIINYLKTGMKNKEIVEKLKTDHGITTNSQNVSKTKKRFNM